MKISDNENFFMVVCLLTAIKLIVIFYKIKFKEIFYSQCVHIYHNSVIMVLHAVIHFSDISSNDVFLHR